MTIYANAGHTWMVIAGLAFDTAHWGPTTPAGTGPRWLIKADATANLDDGTVVPNAVYVNTVGEFFPQFSTL